MRPLPISLFTWLTAMLLAIPMASSIADDDNGEASPLIVRVKTDPAPGESPHCVENYCENQNGYFLDSIYLGSRSDCVFAIDPREPFKQDGASNYTASHWTECPIAADSEDDVCFWGYPTDAGDCLDCRPSHCSDLSACTPGCLDGSTCGGNPQNPDPRLAGRCADGSACVPACSDGSPCFDPRQNRVRWRHATRNDIIGTPSIGSCTAPDEFFDADTSSPETNYCVFIGTTDKYLMALDEDGAHPPPKRDAETGNIIWHPNGLPALESEEAPGASCLWHYKVDNQVWRRTVTPGRDDADGHVYMTSKKGKLTKLDRHPGLAKKTDGDRSPRQQSTWKANCYGDCVDQNDDDIPEGNLLACPLRGPDWEERIDDQTLEAQGGLAVVRYPVGHASFGEEAKIASTSERALLAGTSRGFRTVKLDLSDADVREFGYSSPNGLAFPGGELYNGEGTEQEKAERYLVQDMSRAPDDPNRARFYSGFGASGSDTSGLAAFDLDLRDGTLHPVWKFERSTDPSDLGGAQAGCLEAGEPPRDVSASKVQLHRTSPALSHDGEHVFVTNRQGAGADLSGTAMAFQRQPIEKAGKSVPNLVACARPSPGKGIVSAPGRATVRCELDRANSRCCADPTSTFDRIILLSKAQEVFVYDFCDGTFGNPVAHFDTWYDGSENQNFAEFRAWPAVAEEAGTYYFHDNNPPGERFFAYDLHEPSKLKWVYDISNDEVDNNTLYCKLGIPYGGRDCYPAPMPSVSQEDLDYVSSPGEVVVSVCPHHVEVETLDDYTNKRCKENRLVSYEFTGFKDTDEAGGQDPSNPDAFNTLDLDDAFGVQVRNLDWPGWGPESWAPVPGQPGCYQGVLGPQDFVDSGSPGNTNSFGLTVQNLLGKQGRGRVAIRKPE